MSLVQTPELGEDACAKAQRNDLAEGKPDTKKDAGGLQASHEDLSDKDTSVKKATDEIEPQQLHAARQVLDHSKRTRCLACLQMMFGNENILSDNDEHGFVDGMMNVADTDKFVSFVISKWEATLATLPSFSKADPESTKRLWFVHSWRDMLSDYARLTSDHESVSDEQSKVAADICQYVLTNTAKSTSDTVPSQVWSKILSLAAKDDLSEENQVKALIKKATEADFQTFCAVVESSWNAGWERLPEFAKKDPDVQKQLWFRQNYVQLVEKALTSKLPHDQKADANMAGIAGLIEEHVFVVRAGSLECGARCNVGYNSLAVLEQNFITCCKR